MGIVCSLMRPLEGRIIRLEPLAEPHFDPLAHAASDPEIWRLMSADGSRPDVFRSWFDESLAERIAFATVDAATGVPVGSSSFLSLAPEHRRVEIGHTWLARSHWRTGANVEAKLLMLEHAFGTMGMRRVEFKTDALNERSRRALEALPAQFEGVHRQHMLVRDGENRDSAWYSVLDGEWPAVRENLLRRLGHA
jgi:RimJ/RimL family protein N-acetyltransferase